MQLTSNSFRLGSTDSNCLPAVPSLTCLTRPPAGHQNQSGGVGVDRARHLRRQCDGGDQLTRRQGCASVVVGEQNRCHCDGFGDRTGDAPPAQPLGGDDEVDGVRLDPSNFSGTISAVTPRSASCAHTLRPGAVSPCAHARTAAGRSAAPERGVDAGGEVALLFVELEPHFAFSRGRPRSRSAMMLRWISLVPA